MIISVISAISLGLMLISILIVIIRFKNQKNRENKILYLSSFRHGKGTIVYFIPFCLFFVGYIYNQNHVLNSFIYALKDSVELVVLKLNLNTFSALMSENTCYKVAIYSCFLLVCLNSSLFIFALIHQKLWYFYRMLKYQKRSTDKIIIFGNNAQNHSVYRSDNKNEKIIVGKISNQEAQVLYTKNILYKNEECSQNFITEIITNCIQKKYSTFIVINTNDDNLNLSICNDFIKSMNIMDEKNRVLCYSKLRIFTFGDPKLEKIYEDVVENGCGCISFVNKYKKVAIDLVAKHPFSQYLGENELDYKTACLKKDVEINTLLIGFGKTNQQFFLTSVANNQFMTQEDITSTVISKPVNYYLFDHHFTLNSKKLNHSYHRYKNEFESVINDATKKNDYLPLPNEPANIYAYKLDIYDIQFYKQIKEIVENPNHVNFVVVAYSTDLENIDMAKKIACKFKEWGINNFRIFVKIRDEYNINQISIADNCVIFGNENKVVYNMNSIASDHLEKMAQMRNFVYDLEYSIKEKIKELEQKQEKTGAEKANSLYLSQTEIDKIKKESYKNWYLKKLEYDRESSVYCILSIRSKLNLIGLDCCLKEENDKKALTEAEYLNIYAQGDLPKYYKECNADGKPIVKYPLCFKNSLRLKLAMHEHLRWNAFMISKGFIPASKKQILEEKNASNKHTNGKNISLRRHGNLTTLEGLKEYRNMITDREMNLPQNKEISAYQLLRGNDVIKYDYQIMDDAHWFLTRNGYKIIRKSQNTHN